MKVARVKPARTGLATIGALLLWWIPLAVVQAQATDPSLEQFKRAWNAAARGDRAVFEQGKLSLANFVLHPYLQYEDYRFRRAFVDAAEMADFLDKHSDWAFTTGLRQTWLLALGETRQWEALLRYAPGVQDTAVQCYLAQARIERGHFEAVLPQAQELWAAGQSQPEECDPVFDWLRQVKGITPDLAWLRVKRAMEAGNPRLTSYIARYLPMNERVWVERWQQQELGGYMRLDMAGKWPDQARAWDIATFGLAQLARRDAHRAWTFFVSLDGKLGWDEDQRGAALREIARWSAVANAPETIRRMHAVPASARDDGLLEWWARYGLGSGEWAEVILAVAVMSEELRSSDRWRYWDARARLELGDPDYAMKLLELLSTQASYHGFLAADLLQRPYAICQQDTAVTADELSRFSERPVIRRVDALRRAGMNSWARSEWNLNLKLWNSRERRLAAALAMEQNRPELAIWALNGSEDRQFYDLRFPLVYAALAAEQAEKRNLDTAWVLGLMRTESAMAADAISSANARGLMQVMPATAAQLARRHGQSYRGSEQLLQAADNIVFGTTFLRELMDKFGNNQVLASGAYNAGPRAVTRWLETLPNHDPTIWIETLPYYETRDYIPRVLAFATVYDWRLQKPVQRISSRMPALNSYTMGGGPGSTDTAEVACPGPAAVALSGS